MKVALVYPPTCDPTAPYLSLPTLTAYLRAHDVDVMPVDANLEAWESLLTRRSLERLGCRIETRIANLEKLPSLGHEDQLAYAQLWSARGDAAVAPAIDDALSVFRDRERFYVNADYDLAVETVQAAQRVVSAAYVPLQVDFVSYRTPFSLLDAGEIERDAAPDRDPFHAYFVDLSKRIAASGVGLVGISVAFPGQIQPAYSLAHVLRAHAPRVHVTVGGPALTQMLIRLEGERLTKALGPFHSAIVYEGEVALLDLARAIGRGETRSGVIRGTQVEDMSKLPQPDFDGLPLDRYLAPELVLPYDPSRGCYWGVCTFCHYGLAEVGTARYRERPTETVLVHLEALRDRHGCKTFYFSQDVFSPRIATNIAKGIQARKLGVRWGSDMRPERSLNPERSRTLFEGGAIQAALGVESAAPRVLSLIDKGIPVEDVARAVESLSDAGIAVEAMCFSDFPTETYREALRTVDFVEGIKQHLSLFILGKFDLTHGSLIAQKPGEFGIREVWEVEGDELGTGLFWAERRASKRGPDKEKLEHAIDALSRGWRLRRYPWAGALSTAHTMLYYVRFGKDAFRKLPARTRQLPFAATEHRAKFDVVLAAERSAENEALIWQELTQRKRHVGRIVYEPLAASLPKMKPSRGTFVVMAGHDVVARRPRAGRRPSNAHNALKE